MDWYVRKLKPQDKDRFLAFLGNWVKKYAVEKHYEWLYLGNPHGKALTWLTIDCQNAEIIGCTSVFPRKIWFKGHICLASIGGDTYVDPKFRRKGIAMAMYRAQKDDLKGAGIKFHYGFPLAANFKTFLKMGTYYPGSFVQTRLLLRSEPALRKLKLGKTVSNLLSKLLNKFLSAYINIQLEKSEYAEESFKKISNFDARFDRLMGEIIPSFEICCVRDSEFLNWRYFGNPLQGQTVFSYEVNGSPVGYAVLAFSRNTGIIFDFFVKSKDELAHNFIAFLIRFVVSNASEKMITMVNPLGVYSDVFSMCGLKVKSRSTRRPLIVLPALDDEDVGYMKSLENYYFTYGDTDLESI